MEDSWFLPPESPLFDRFQPARPPAATADALRDSIFDHLLVLLNSRRNWRAGELPAELERTVIGWGLPDQGGFSPRSAGDRLRLRQAITAALAAYEPRLTDIQVTDATMSDRADRPVFRIKARIRMPGADMELSRDAVLDMPSHRFDRRDGRAGR